jgi:S-adenosyl-L-methionine hydrolase (adenosine-forming)
MPFITLTSDYGYNDFALADWRMKTMSTFVTHTIIDISHSISKFNLYQTSYIFKGVIQGFEKGSIHCINVDLVGGNHQMLVVYKNDQVYIMPDNGLICMVFPDHQSLKVVKIPFGLPQVFGNAIHWFYNDIITQILNDSLDDELYNNYILSNHYSPVITSDTIHATVIYIDEYHNAITNIEKSLFDKERGVRGFEIELNRKDRINKMSRYYNDVVETEMGCFFNSTGHLEIFINKGKASSVLNLTMDKQFIIEFV